MKAQSLSVQPRELSGKQVKTLRAKGQLPATIYGKTTKSVSVTVDKEAFLVVYRQTGETGLIELELAGAKRPVLVHNVQLDAVYGEPLHIEFHQVDLKEKVHANVPLSFVGEASAVTQKIGVFFAVLSEVEVEALPTDLPEHIEIDITSLAEVGAEITVAQLAMPSGVTLLTDPTLTVAKIATLVSKEAAAEEAADAAKASEAAATTDAAGETDAAPKEEAAPQESSEK